MMTRKGFVCAVSVVGWLIVALGCVEKVAVKEETAMKADFYVATDGNDAWSGRQSAPKALGNNGPFASVARAARAVREARTPGQKTPYTVLIRGGVYRLTEPLVFTHRDSGAEGAPVVYAAFPGEKPVLSGGRPIKGWKRGQGDIWTAEVPEVKAGKWYFQQLFVNGERRTRARTPNDGYLRCEGPIEPLGDRTKARGEKTKKMGFRYNAGDIQRWAGLEDVNIVLFHAWTASVQWIESLDEKERIVRFTAPCGWPVAWWEKDQRYYVENYREALDSPGEWYLDRKTGVLSYWPMPGEDMSQADVVAPAIRQLVRFAGEGELGAIVEHITLRGLSFQHAEWVVADKGPADGQAGVGFMKGAVHANGTHHCALENCEIAHVGEYAVWLGSGCKSNRIVRCHIHDLGGGGVCIGETESPKNEHVAAERNLVDNCFIHDGGKVFREGIGVIILRSSHNTVTHNDVCDFDYSGMSVGWCWGYAPSSANNNLVEYNHIHHIGRGVLSDMGGIYTLGVSPGTRLRHNVIHDVHSYSYGGWGLYTDEGSTDILMENNVVYNTKTGGFHQHYGRENILRNNIFAFSLEGQIIRSRQEDHVSFTLERNIIYCDNGQPLGGNWSNGNYRMDNNLYWDTSDPEFEMAGMTWEEWRAKGFDQRSIIADPLFTDPKNGVFTLKRGSPAEKIGFKPIDVSLVGLYGDLDWVEAPKRVERKPYTFPMPPGPQPVDDGFEDTAVGEPPKLARVSGEELGASIRVTEETAATGKRSLKITDAPGLAHEWQPHMYYNPRFDKGLVRLSFDLRLEPGAIVAHEWRDTASPYRVGPSIRIEKNGDLKAGKEKLIGLPLGQWVRFEFVCGLGKLAGQYDLTITLPGQAPKKLEKLPAASPEWRKLHWLGFMSNATAHAVFYLDNMKLTCEK